MKVAFIGLGNMGASMASNLLKAGFDLVVHNRTPSKADALVRRGARAAATAADAAGQADVVLACLTDVGASHAVFLSPGGVLDRARPGQLFADHGTVDLETSRRQHAAARARGAAFLDAPVSGGPDGAAAATLAIMVGGEAAAFERGRPVLEAMGRTALHMGPGGAGTAAKLANQLLVGVHTAASCEALLLAERAGVDLEKLVAVLMRSWGSSRMLERNAPYIRTRRFEGTGAPLRNIVKDLKIIAALGAATGLALPLTETARSLFARLEAGGLGELDMTALCRLLDEAPAAPAGGSNEIPRNS
jgi:3-hydroxyisobutyrate dehydrogenase-like beta-hydroxyacid dehydrogenase